MSAMLKRAETNMRLAHHLMTPDGNPTGDEMMTDLAAYHTQQGIEKALKYQAELMGLPLRKTHHIELLIQDLEEAGFSVNKKLSERARMISTWATESRYNDSFFVLKADINEAFELYESLKTSILKHIEAAQ